MSIEIKPQPKTCDWCEKEEPHRWFGGWWICLPCDRDFFSRNGRMEKVQAWLRQRGSSPRTKALRKAYWFKGTR